jgi:hypothetical protein
VSKLNLHDVGWLREQTAPRAFTSAISRRRTFQMLARAPQSQGLPGAQELSVTTGVSELA